MGKAKRRFAAVALFAVVLPLFGWAQGLLLPGKHAALPELVRNVVRIDVEENVARVSATHVFHNKSSQVIEGVFYLPLPRNATVTDLTSEVNGKTLEGRLLGNQEAERVYEEIVRRDLDPALLQLLDYRILKLSIYPLESGKEAKITVRYQMELPVERNTTELRYPLRTDVGQGRSRSTPLPILGARPGRVAPEHRTDTTVVENVRLQIHIRSRYPIGNLYSPTHTLSVEREGENDARVSVEAAGGANQFVLYWTLARGPMAVGLLAQREKGEDGTFLLSVAPAWRAGAQRIPVDVAFVLDVSGSMDGAKIEQAKRALLTCLDSLSAGDRFAIVTFSDQVTAYHDAWLPANRRQDVRGFVRAQTAGGGTNLFGALERVLRLPQDNERFQLILLLTDGRPTAGETRLGPIVRLVQDNLGEARVFAFGVGSDVDAVLLDKIAERGRGFTLYVSEQEVAKAVESFFMRVRRPVLSDLRLDLGDPDAIYDVYPPSLPDLFYGSEIRVAGRYRAPGQCKATLRGKLRGREVVYHFDLDLPERDVMHPFVPRVWAARKIGYLLDQIRMNGESDELVREVRRLSRKFGLLTPYTSFLTQERALQASVPDWSPPVLSRPSQDRSLSFVPRPRMEIDQTAPDGIAAPSGAGLPNLRAKSVQAAARIGALKRAETVPVHRGVRYAAGRTFVFQDSVWVEVHLMDQDTTFFKAAKVQYGSRAFFWLLRQGPEVRQILSLGKRVHFIWRNARLEIGPSGIQDPQELRRILTS